MRVAEYPLQQLHWVIRHDPWVRAIFLAAGVPMEALAERILDVSTFEDSEAMMIRSLTLWERILGIVPEEDASMEERRADVRAMWLAALPPSIATIQAVCDAWRAGEIEAGYEADIGTIVLTYLEHFGPQDRQGGLVRALDIVKPAHLALEHAWRYLRVKEVHRQMSVAELEQTPRGWFAGYRARLLPGTPRAYRRASGSVVSLLSPQAWPLRGCTVEIRPAQEGSGEPSPENVRPIAGWPGAEIVVSPLSAELAGTAASMAAGTVVSVAFPAEAGTVCGGTLDVTNGVLTVTHKGITFDGSESWSTVNNPDNIRYFATMTVGDDFVIGSEVYSHTVHNSNIKTSQTATDVQYGAKIYKTSTIGALRMIICLPDMPDTAADFKAMLAGWAQAGTPLQVRYALAEPVTYQLTPQEVVTLAGRSFIRADCGDIAVEYASAESADYALSGKDRFRGSGILRFGPCLVVRERSKITVRRTGDRLDISDSPTYRYEAPAYEQIGDGLWAVDGALTVAADSMVSARTDGDTLMIADKVDEPAGESI